ncbi:unnamed protein product [Fusarium graminearum]|nr:unnamed protein product [Fusarium graminearum]
MYLCMLFLIRCLPLLTITLSFLFGRYPAQLFSSTANAYSVQSQDNSTVDNVRSRFLNPYGISAPTKPSSLNMILVPGRSPQIVYKSPPLEH